MSLHYRQQVAKLAAILCSLIDPIELTPNADDKLDIDLFGDLAGILGLATNKNGSLDESDPFLRQVKVVAGIGFEPMTFRL